MQLDGNLSRFSLRELLELSAASLVNGAIEVHAPSGTHRIVFVQGCCVHATSPDANGFDAIWPLFELRDAPFQFVTGVTVRDRTITQPIDVVIKQAETLARQWLKIRPHIPNLEIIPELITPANGEQVRIFEEDWPILSWVDGTRTIAAIARSAVRDPIEVCIGLLRLRERGLLTLTRRAPAVDLCPTPAVADMQRAVASAPTAPARKQSSFFAKFLVAMPDDAFAPVPAAPVLTTTAVAPAAKPALAPSAISAAPMPNTRAAQAAPPEYDDILRLLRG